MQCHTGGVLLFISNPANNPKMAECGPSRKHVVIFSQQSLYPESENEPEMEEVLGSLDSWDDNFELCYTSYEEPFR